MAKISTLTIEELYEEVAKRGRATPSVLEAIRKTEDFSSISMRYCNNVCKAHSCLSPEDQSVDNDEADVVILLGGKAKDGKYKGGEYYDSLYMTMIDHFMTRECPGVSYKIVYALKCRPPKLAKPISVVASRPCSSYAIREINSAGAKVIVAMSTASLKALGLKLSVKNNLSEIHAWNNIPVVVTLHPEVTTMIRQSASGAFWGDDFYELIRRDFAKVRRVVKEGLGPSDPRQTIKTLVDSEQIKVLRTEKDIIALCEELSSLPSQKIISWDTETTGLDPWANNAKFLCMQFGIRRPDGLCYGYVIPLWHRDNTWVDPDAIWPYVKKVLESPVAKVGHHGKFDLKYTRVVTGVKVTNYLFDTLYASHSLCSGLQGTYGLKKAVWDWIPESGLGGYEDLLIEPEVEEDE